jgi:hypothetical protein
MPKFIAKSPAATNAGKPIASHIAPRSRRSNSRVINREEQAIYRRWLQVTVAIYGSIFLVAGAIVGGRILIAESRILQWVPKSGTVLLSKGIYMHGTDCLGFIASAAVLASFCMTTIVPLRTFALASNVLFICYGILGHIYPVLLLHLILLPINLVKLQRIQAKRNFADAARSPYPIAASNQGGVTWQA